jgi:hypothetical protein
MNGITHVYHLADFVSRKPEDAHLMSQGHRRVRPLAPFRQWRLHEEDLTAADGSNLVQRDGALARRRR